MTRVLAWALEDPRLISDPDFTHIDPLWIGVIPEEGLAFRVWGDRLAEATWYRIPNVLAVEWTAWAEAMGLELRPEMLVCQVGDVYLNDLRNGKLSHLGNVIARILRDGERVTWYT